MYTEVKAMAEKKTEVITFRTDATISEMLDELRSEKEWSRSKMVEKILQEYYLKWKEEKGGSM